MIPASDLVRAKGVNDAKAVIKRCPDFDIIPLPYEGEISGYYHKGVVLRIFDMMTNKRLPCEEY
jgi:hypothetical protein